MDARLNVYGILGLQEGEAHVIRNAGGVVTDDEIRSLKCAGSSSTSRPASSTRSSESGSRMRSRAV
jgi:hypothetical protein